MSESLSMKPFVAVPLNVTLFCLSMGYLDNLVKQNELEYRGTMLYPISPMVADKKTGSVKFFSLRAHRTQNDALRYIMQGERLRFGFSSVSNDAALKRSRLDEKPEVSFLFKDINTDSWNYVSFFYFYSVYLRHRSKVGIAGDHPGRSAHDT